MSSHLQKSTSSCKRIYVGNLPKDVRKVEIEDLFGKYGRINTVDIHNNYDPAFAFIEFDDPRDATDAIECMDDKKQVIDREEYRLKVQVPLSDQDRNRGRGGYGGGRYGGGGGYSDRPRGNYTRGRGRGAPIKHSDYRVLVSNLPPTGSWQDLKDHMREAGEVLCADVYKDGTGVCEFARRKDMEWAAKYLDDSKFRSHENESANIRVKLDGPARSRSRSRGRRGRSYSRSRSRSRSPRRSRSPSPARRSRSASRSPRYSRYSRSRSR